MHNLGSVSDRRTLQLLKVLLDSGWLTNVASSVAVIALHVLLLVPGSCRRMCKMLNAAAADRNKDPILAVLKRRVTSDRPLVALEISSGTGQHVIHFAKAFPNITWHPSEIEAQSISR